MKKTEIAITTSKSIQLKNISPEIIQAVRESGINDGICFVFCPHTTAGLIINENADPDVVSDMERALPQAVPDVRFDHLEGNSPAHYLTCVTRPSIQVIVENGELALGRWQGIFFGEFDGPRRRKVWVKVMGE
jgi:secondary thiamine-phosphate synthase enzyme